MGSEECMSGKAIYQNFIDGLGTRPLMESQQSIGMVSQVYDERVSQIKKLATSMEEGWAGKAAGAAQRGAGPLAEAHARASVEMHTAKELLSRQSESFGVARVNVVDVPDVPKEPSLFKKVVTLGSAQNGYEDKVEASNAANQRNIAVMRDWADASSTNGAMMPTDYGDIPTDKVKFDVKEESVGPWKPVWPEREWPPKPVEHKGGDDGKKVGNGDDKKVGTDDDKLRSDEKIVRPPAEDRPIGIPERPPPPLNDDWRNTFPEQIDKPDILRPPVSDGKDELTRPEDFTPEKPGDRPGWNLPGGPGGTGGTGGTSGTGQGSSSGTGFGPFGGLGGSGSSSGSGSGSGRFGSGSGTGSASGLGGEKSLGGRGAGSASGAAEAMGRGGAAGAKGIGGGAAGRPGGAGGVPGMGAGQRGQGDEDEEHQRKYIVDDDEAFQLTDDGERLTDPRTGMPLTPPVIGE
jgi:hypothetical protein